MPTRGLRGWNRMGPLKYALGLCRRGDVKNDEARNTPGTCHSKNLGSIRLHGERREYPRIETTLPVEISLSSGQVVGATGTNVSRARLQLTRNHGVAPRIYPEGKIVPGRPLTLRLHFAVAGRFSGNVDVPNSWPPPPP